MARTVITGATGTIGSALSNALMARGDQVVALSRNPSRARAALGDAVEHHAWPYPKQAPPPAEALSGADVVLHLLGEPIAQRWNAQVKREIEESRVLSTRMLVAGLKNLPAHERPSVLVSQSATGYYGAHGDEPLDEDAPAGDDFLAGVVVAWESEAHAIAGEMRVVCTRTGVVLSPSGGALGTMLPFFRLGLGGPVAGGRQYVPWIHLDDVIGALMRCASDDGLQGPVNLTAPSPVTNHDLTKSLARALHRPAIFPVPSAALKLLYGEMAQVVSTGARVLPRRLEAAGYGFAYAELDPALRDLLG
jgi:uncharacterized protein (TIGR01777 family)